jgi:DICT domain-containing protein
MDLKIDFMERNAIYLAVVHDHYASCVNCVDFCPLIGPISTVSRVLYGVTVRENETHANTHGGFFVFLPVG